jgi:hypothetical protein
MTDSKWLLYCASELLARAPHLSQDDAVQLAADASLDAARPRPEQAAHVIASALLRWTDAFRPQQGARLAARGLC